MATGVSRTSITPFRQQTSVPTDFRFKPLSLVAVHLAEIGARPDVTLTQSRHSPIEGYGTSARYRWVKTRRASVSIAVTVRPACRRVPAYSIDDRALGRRVAGEI